MHWGRYQGQYGIGKIKDINFYANKSPVLKKGKSGLFNQFKKKREGYQWVLTNIQMGE
jgi:hypothetical protein